jgi:hypothetical protein
MAPQCLGASTSVNGSALMRALVTVLHVYNPGGSQRYSSSLPDPAPRVEALRTCLRSLRAAFSPESMVANLGHKTVTTHALQDAVQLDIVICTAGDMHLLDRIDNAELPLRLHQSDAEPMLAGFDCRQVLAEGLGTYDFYCYIEDDIIVSDPMFFAKLRWFDRLMGSECLLQPNRFELGDGGRPPKIYIDGPIDHDATRLRQEVRDRPESTLYALGREVRFIRPLNPHSACYFLNATQMQCWASRPDFNERDVSFVGQLESMATLGIMMTFRVYKPAPENATFLEVRHLDSRWWQRVAGELEWLE